MANVTAERNTFRMGDQVVPVLFNQPMSASLKVWKGAIVAISTAVATKGQVVKAGASAAQVVMGEALQTVDNSAGAASALTCDIRAGVFYLANGAGAEALTEADKFKPCYMGDDQTVQRDSSAGTKPFGGIVILVDAGGVWVQVGPSGLGAANSIYTAGVPAMTAIANSSVLARFLPGFAGKLLATDFLVTTAVTTGAKAATLTPKIATVACTGGVISLAGAYAQGARVAGTAVTALNIFGAADELTVEASAVTAFAEGAGQVQVTLGL